MAQRGYTALDRRKRRRKKWGEGRGKWGEEGREKSMKEFVVRLFCPGLPVFTSW